MLRKTFQMMAVALAMLATACGGVVDGTGETGYRNVGNEGGEVKARDTVVSVPAGAVDQSTELSITPAPQDQLPEGSAGAAIDLGPDAMDFREAVTVQLRYQDERLPDPTRRDLVWIGTVVDGEWEPLEDPVNDETSRLARGATRRSGRFGVVHGCGRGRRCPVALDYVSPPQHILAGDCSEAAVLKTVDWSGRTSPVRHDTVVGLTADEPNINYFADRGCTQQISSLRIPARHSGATFFFRGRVARSVTITAQARDLRPASQDESITAGGMVRFSFVTPQQRVMGGACSQVATVAFQDWLGNRAPVPGDARVILSAAASGQVTLYSDPQCTTATAGITMPAGTASVDLWFKGTLSSIQTEQITITGSVGAFGAAFTASQVEWIYPPPPSSLRFFSLPQTVAPGACSAPTMVGVVDGGGNRTTVDADTAVDLTAPNGFALYADQFCNTLVGRGVTIPSNSGSASFYFKAFNAGTYRISAAAANLGSATQDETAQ